MMTFDIKKTTHKKDGRPKAYLIIADGQTAWIKAAWLNKHGDLTPGAIKALDDAKQAKLAKIKFRKTWADNWA